MTEPVAAKRPRGRPRIHKDDAARKKAHQDNKIAKRGADKLAADPPSGTEPITVRAKVIEPPAPPSIVAPPLHSSAGDVPEAGTEGGGLAPTSSAVATAEPAVVVLDAKVMTSIVKGVFALIALRGGEHWKVEDDEIEPIAEPLCRQAMRIPLVAALGQDTADLILIGSTMGALIYMRAQQSIDERRAGKPVERKRAVTRDNVVDLRPEPGETATVPEASAGGRTQEVREPGEPEINLAAFQSSQAF